MIDMTNIFKIDNTSSNHNTYNDINYQVKKPVLSFKTKIDNNIKRQLIEKYMKGWTIWIVIIILIFVIIILWFITPPVKSENSIRNPNSSSVKGNNNVFNSRNNFGPSKVFNLIII